MPDVVYPTATEMLVWRDELEADVAAFMTLCGGDPQGPYYDCETIDAWAASKGFHIDRSCLEEQGYMCVCAFRAGATLRVSISNVMTRAQQEANWQARYGRADAQHVGEA